MDAPTVLLIDGDTDSLTIYSLILEHNGFRVLRTADGAQGFRLACEHQPDLVVLEPFAPRLQGRTLPELLRTDSRTAHLPLLQITSVPSLLDVVGTERTDLVKPCQPQRFLEEVQRRLAPPLSLAH